MAKGANWQWLVSRPSLFLFVVLIQLGSVLSQGGIRYPATIKTKGASTTGEASVDLRNYDNDAQIYFTYDATLQMGSSTNVRVRASTADGDRQVSSERQPGEDFTRIITQKVTKSRDANGLTLTVYIQTTLKLADGKEKYGKTSISVRVAPGRRGAHYWDIKHEISNNYEGEGEGEVCLGCDVDEREDQIDAAGQEPAHERGNPYGYRYSVNDSPSQSLYRSDAESDGETVRGEYRVLLPDGRTQVVTYTADWRNGYRPVVKYE